MSGGDQLSENQSSASDQDTNIPQPDVAASIRAVFDECMRNPYKFVENERIQRDK